MAKAVPFFLTPIQKTSRLVSRCCWIGFGIALDPTNSPSRFFVSPSVCCLASICSFFSTSSFAYIPRLPTVLNGPLRLILPLLYNCVCSFLWLFLFCATICSTNFSFRSNPLVWIEERLSINLLLIILTHEHNEPSHAKKSSSRGANSSTNQFYNIFFVERTEV